MLTPLITTPILSRALGAEKLGIYSATLAYVNYFTLFAMLGIENHGNRSIAAINHDSEKQSKVFINIYAIQFFTSIIALVVYYISLLFVSKDRCMIAIIQGLWLLSSVFNINWFFFGTEQFKVTVTRSIILKIISVLLIVLFVHKPDDINIYALIIVSENVLSNVVLWLCLKKEIKFIKPSFSLIKENISPVLVLFIPIAAMSVYHIMDKTMLDIFSNETEVGYYYSADKMINIPLGMINALGTVMLPRISNIISKGKEQDVRIMLQKSTELMLFLSGAVGIGIASVAKEFVPLFFGQEFTPCIQLVYWFVPVLFFKAISDLIRAQYMIPAHKDKFYIMAVGIGAFTNLICNIILIPKFSSLGAVFGTLIAESVVAITEIIFSVKEIPFLKFIFNNSLYLIFGLVMFLVTRICSDRIQMSILLKIISLVLIGGFVYMALCAVYWKIQKHSIFHSYVSK